MLHNAVHHAQDGLCLSSASEWDAVSYVPLRHFVTGRKKHIVHDVQRPFLMENIVHSNLVLCSVLNTPKCQPTLCKTHSVSYAAGS